VLSSGPAQYPHHAVDSVDHHGDPVWPVVQCDGSAFNHRPQHTVELFDHSPSLWDGHPDQGVEIHSLECSLVTTRQQHPISHTSLSAGTAG